MADKAHDKHSEHGGGGEEHKSGGHGGGHGHGVGHEDHHEGAPEWLISFADNVALMMGFFVILLAMNMAKQTAGGIGGEADMGGNPSQANTMIDFAIAVREAFNNPVDINSNNPREAKLVKRLIERKGKSETRDPGIKGYEQDVQSIRPSDYYAICGSIPFAENSCEWNDSMRPAVEEIAKKVRGLTLIVEVRGHVSSAEAAQDGDAPMRLSFQRALVIGNALADAGVDRWQLRLAQSADHERIEAFPNGAKADRANARVEVVVTAEVAPDKVPTKKG
jgi:outer membrane protein OmpA-like peptidoglycan-associated protein